MKFDFGEKSFFVYVYVHPLPAFMAPDTDLSRSIKTVHNKPGLQYLPPSSHNMIFTEKMVQTYRSDRCLSNPVALCFGKEKKSPAYSCRSVWMWPKGALTEKTAGAGLSFLC